MPVPPALRVVVVEVHQPELYQQVSNLMDVRVLGFSGAGSEVTYHYGILVQEVS